jgi:mRNA interferase HigB
MESRRHVHVVAKSRIEQFANEHKDARTSLLTWWKTADGESWQHIVEVKQTYSHADYDSDTGLTIFNIKGNKYRLRVRIDYKRQIIYVHDFMTHAEYDKLD